MNWLAHVFLSENHIEHQLGNLLTDPLKDKAWEGASDSFQRAWVKYELGEGINTNIGVVDYIGGSLAFDAIKDNDMIFADISYNF